MTAAHKANSAPEYWQRALRELKRRDPVLRGVIVQHQGKRLTHRSEPFLTLARAIVAQQISVKAAQSVWDKLAARFPEVSPEKLRSARLTSLRGCGLSARKCEYIRDLARRFASGSVDPGAWHALDDEAVIRELIEVKGIGRWTAEMFLIFNLLRPDVLPLDDLGLQRAMSRLYGEGAVLGRAALIGIAEVWRPWRTVGTWFMWRSLEPLPARN
jgi:DNA-3-methyladenine glycosylase II